MNNILIGLKRFFTNKNTVTIICVLGIVFFLYFGYNWRIKKSTEPLSVPYAKEEIQPRTGLNLGKQIKMNVLIMEVLFYILMVHL